MATRDRDRPAGSPSGVAAVDRAAGVMPALERFPDGARISDLAAATGLALATLGRLIASLEHAGLARRGVDMRCALGPALLRLGQAYRGSLRLERWVVPVLAELGAPTADAASFSVRDGDHRLCLFRVESTLPLREPIASRDRFPLATGTASRVLRASDDEPNADARDDLADVRRRGYAVSLGERVRELAAVAAPVFGVAGGGRASARRDVVAAATRRSGALGATTPTEAQA